MSHQRYTEEFWIVVVKQITEYNRSVTEIAAPLGVSSHRLYQ